MIGTLGSAARSWLRRPRTRAWLLAGFLALHLALAAPLAILAADWDRPEPDSWLRQLNFDGEGTAANLYSGILWGGVAALAAAQLFRPAISVRGPRWLWMLGWLSAALLAALVALEELADLKDTLGRWEALNALQASWNLARLPVNLRWAVVVVPCIAPLAAAAGWVAYTSLRRHPALALLAVLAVALGVGTAVHDQFGVLYGTTSVWVLFIEEGSEIMAGATLAVVLVELLAARLGPARGVLDVGKERGGRWSALAATAALLAAATFALLAEYDLEDERWVKSPSAGYTGPVSLIEQRFRATHDNLSRMSVWAYVHSPAGAAASADIFARLTPALGWSPGPLRESRAEVHGTRFSNTTVGFDFEPIPDSGGKLYTLAIGVLSGPEPYVFLGLTRGDEVPEGEVLISGSPTGYGNDLALRTYWAGQGFQFVAGLLSHWVLIADAVATVFVWTFLIAAAWGGLSGDQPRFWRGYVGRALRRAALLATSLAAVALALLPVLAGTTGA